MVGLSLANLAGVVPKPYSSGFNQKRIVTSQHPAGIAVYPIITELSSLILMLKTFFPPFPRTTACLPTMEPFNAIFFISQSASIMLFSIRLPVILQLAPIEAYGPISESLISAVL
jgi:hypothetical protein